MRSLQNEARFYWATTQRVRLNLRKGADLTDALDDLSLLTAYAGHPIIQREGEALMNRASEALRMAVA